MLKKKKRRAKKYEREIDKVSQLEKQVRELKSINRSLMKQLKKLNKSKHEFEELSLLLEEVSEDEFESAKCSNCGKGNLVVTVLAGRQFERCDTCDFRSRAKKV